MTGAVVGHPTDRATQVPLDETFKLKFYFLNFYFENLRIDKKIEQTAQRMLEYPFFRSNLFQLPLVM